MKKALLIILFVIILAAIAFIGFGGFGLLPMSDGRSTTVMADTAAVTEEPAPSADPFADSVEETAEPTEEPVETETPEDAGTSAEEAPQPGLVASESRNADAYKDVLNSYKKAQNEGWTAAQYTASGLDPMPAALGKGSKLGYALHDIDLDGTDEMLIGKAGTCEIYAIYTLSGNTPSMLAGADTNSRYYLEPDGIIVNVVKKDVSRGGYLFYRYENGILALNNGLIYDYNANPQYPWFYTKSDDFNSSGASKTSNTRAESAISAYKANYVKPEYILLDEYI